MRNRGKDLLQSYLDDALEFDEVGAFDPKPMLSRGIEKDSLLGQNLNVEVFEIRFQDAAKNSYTWVMDGKVIASGSMPKAYNLVHEIIHTYRDGNPKHVYLHFPNAVPPTIGCAKAGHSEVLPVPPSDIFDFKRATEGFTKISVADEASTS